jgi:hypothetical protein
VGSDPVEQVDERNAVAAGVSRELAAAGDYPDYPGKPGLEARTPGR